MADMQVGIWPLSSWADGRITTHLDHAVAVDVDDQPEGSRVRWAS
ncbi:MAG: hypothetical protein ACRDZN_05410 [Acidimicrobiales bacterium]